MNGPERCTRDAKKLLNALIVGMVVAFAVKSAPTLGGSASTPPWLRSRSLAARRRRDRGCREAGIGVYIDPHRVRVRVRVERAADGWCCLTARNSATELKISLASAVRNS